MLKLTIYDYLADAGRSIGCLFGQPTDTQGEMHEMLFSTRPYLPETVSLVSDCALSTIDLTSDYASVLNDSEALAVSVISHSPHRNHDWVKELILADNMMNTYQSYGSQTGINLISGIIKAIQAISTLQFAQMIGDRRAVFAGQVGLVESVSQAATGVAGAGQRGLTIAQAVEKASSSSVIGRLSQGFSWVGLIFYSIYFAVLGINFGVKAHESNCFMQKLAKKETLLEKVQFLHEKMTVDPVKVRAKLLKKYGSEERVSAHLREVAFESAKCNLKQLLADLNITGVSDEQMDQMIQESLQSHARGFSLASTDKKIQSYLESRGLAYHLEKTKIKKEAKLSRVLNTKGLQALEGAGNLAALIERLKTNQPDPTAEAKDLIDKVTSSNARVFKEATIISALMFFGVAAMIASIVISSGLSLVVLSAILLVFGLTMTAIDGYFVYKSYQDEKRAPHDKMMLSISSLFAIGSFATIVALGVSGVISFGIAPIIVAGILMAVWLAQNGISYWVLKRNERLFAEKHPTFEGMLKAVENGQNTRVEKMLQNLTPIQRTLIDNEKNQLATDDLAQVLRNTIAKVEEAKKERLERLRHLVTNSVVKEISA